MPLVARRGTGHMPPRPPHAPRRGLHAPADPKRGAGQGSGRGGSAGVAASSAAHLTLGDGGGDWRHVHVEVGRRLL